MQPPASTLEMSECKMTVAAEKKAKLSRANTRGTWLQAQQQQRLRKMHHHAVFPN